MVETVRAFANWLPTIAPALSVVTIGGLAFVAFAVWFTRWLERYDPKNDGPGGGRTPTRAVKRLGA